MKIKLTLIATLMATSTLLAQPSEFTRRIRQLDPNLPGKEARLFAPGKISTSTDDWKMAISPTGDEIVYTVTGRAQAALVHILYKDGKWSSPKVLPFSGRYFDCSPTLSADGQEMIFVSKRPTGRPDDANRNYFWRVRREGDTWGTPTLLSDPVNQAGDFLSWPALGPNDDLYFTMKAAGGLGKLDLYRSVKRDGVYQKPENLGAPVNSAQGEYCPFVAPDGSYLIFEIVDGEGGLGGGDLVISVKQDDGRWSAPRHLGEAFNSRAHDCYPTLSPDGQYLFFQSERRVSLPRGERTLTYEQLLKQCRDSGGWDLYWISTDALTPFLK